MRTGLLTLRLVVDLSLARSRRAELLLFGQRREEIGRRSGHPLDRLEVGVVPRDRQLS